MIQETTGTPVVTGAITEGPQAPISAVDNSVAPAENTPAPTEQVTPPATEKPNLDTLPTRTLLNKINQKKARATLSSMLQPEQASTPSEPSETTADLMAAAQTKLDQILEGYSSFDEFREKMIGSNISLVDEAEELQEQVAEYQKNLARGSELSRLTQEALASTGLPKTEIAEIDAIAKENGLQLSATTTSGEKIQLKAVDVFVYAAMVGYDLAFGNGSMLSLVMEKMVGNTIEYTMVKIGVDPKIIELFRFRDNHMYQEVFDKMDSESISKYLLSLQPSETTQFLLRINKEHRKKLLTGDVINEFFGKEKQLSKQTLSTLYNSMTDQQRTDLQFQNPQQTN